MSFYSPRSIYAPHYMRLGWNRAGQVMPPKGQLCPNCGHVRQFHNVKSNWVRHDPTVILNNYYPVKVCTGCSHRIYPAEMLQEYNQLKTQKVLV